MIKLYMCKYTVKNAPLVIEKYVFSALERMFTKELTYERMLEEERIARIGSNDPESHLGIPCSHVSANILRSYREEDTVLGVGKGGAGGAYVGGGGGSPINHSILSIFYYIFVNFLYTFQP
jgi:hypothetical protein